MTKQSAVFASPRPQGRLPEHRLVDPKLVHGADQHADVVGNNLAQHFV